MAEWCVLRELVEEEEGLEVEVAENTLLFYELVYVSLVGCGSQVLLFYFFAFAFATSLTTFFVMINFINGALTLFSCSINTLTSEVSLEFFLNGFGDIGGG